MQLEARMSQGSIYQKLILPSTAQALPGRSEPLATAERHFVNGLALKPPFRQGSEQVLLGMGCFWGAERHFWQQKGIEVTAVGYAGGISPNPTYEEVCTGQTAHTEAVLVVFDPRVIRFEYVLKHFWENHNPTQGPRQGNDIGTQYRSAIYVSSDEQLMIAQASMALYQVALWQKNLGGITTEIKKNQVFYYAEAYHQQYLAKEPGGYCNLQSIQKTSYPPLVVG
jgi:peptide-methionine (S)-S-oxide reductase